MYISMSKSLRPLYLYMSLERVSSHANMHGKLHSTCTSGRRRTHCALSYSKRSSSSTPTSFATPTWPSEWSRRCTARSTSGEKRPMCSSFATHSTFGAGKLPTMLPTTDGPRRSGAALRNSKRRRCSRNPPHCPTTCSSSKRF